MPMKICARPILRRPRLPPPPSSSTPLISGATIAACGFPHPRDARHPDPAADLPVGLLPLAAIHRPCRSLAYADIPPERMSASTSLGVMLQQVRQRGGRGAGGAGAAELAGLARAAASLAPADFRLAFLAVGGAPP